MRRATLPAAVLTVAALIAVACQTDRPAEASSIGDEWGTRADQAIARAIQLDTPGKATVFNWSFLATAIATRSPDGWNDPQALAYMHKVLSRRHADGGFGLDFPYDLFGDGTVNPAGTAYTVSMTDHVGEMMLDAYAAGVLHRYYVDTLLAKLASMPLLPGVSPGYCVAYSDHPNDRRTAGMCAHNVNSGLAAFLAKARAAGFTQASQWTIMEGTRHEVFMYRDYDRSWFYWGAGSYGGRLQDSDHNAYQVESMYQIAPGIADAALAWMMSRTLDATSSEAHVRLAKFDCSGSARWLPEYDARTATSSWVWGSLDRMAYFSRLLAQAAQACD